MWPNLRFRGKISGSSPSLKDIGGSFTFVLDKRTFEETSAKYHEGRKKERPLKITVPQLRTDSPLLRTVDYDGL